MLLLGVTLLAPGLCAGAFALNAIFSPRDPYHLSGLGSLWLACFAVSAGGIALIVWALRRL
jgi:hypothetical protein